MQNTVKDPEIVSSARLEQASGDIWRERAFALQVEVRDLLIEQQRLQYLVESLTNHLAMASQEGYRVPNKKVKGAC